MSELEAAGGVVKEAGIEGTLRRRTHEQSADVAKLLSWLTLSHPCCRCRDQRADEMGSWALPVVFTLVFGRPSCLISPKSAFSF